MQANDDDNNYKWPSIGLTVGEFKRRLLGKNPNFEAAQKMIFDTKVYASVKYDGTNVGIDTDGLMYGRRKVIPQTTKVYQKTKLDGVKAIDAKEVLDAICKKSGIDDQSEILKFLVYGELMCNNLFNYSDDKLVGTYQIFGAILVPKNEEAMNGLSKKLESADFAYGVHRLQGDDDEELSDEGAQGEDNDFDKALHIVMNEAYSGVLDGLKYPIVPRAKIIGTLYDLVMGNYDWMVKGHGEGLVIALPSSGQTKLSKWKIGAEANQTNIEALENILLALEDDKEQKFFGANLHQKAVDFFAKCEAIQKSSKKIEPKAEPPKQPNKPKNTGPTPEVLEKYAEPIKSAKSKFDHADVYFEKGGKGMNEYVKLIAEECLNDIQIDSKDKKAMTAHNKIVLVKRQSRTLP